MLVIYAHLGWSSKQASSNMQQQSYCKGGLQSCHARQTHSKKI